MSTIESTDMTEKVEKMLELAHGMKEKSHCPYSKFRVGAAVLCEDGRIFTGCNVENACPVGVCAEVTAFSKAVSEGSKKFTAVAIASDLKHWFCTPCGQCRQFMSEFGLDLDIYMTKPDCSYRKMKLKELLPGAFLGPALGEEKVDQTENKEIVTNGEIGDAQSKNS